MTSSIRDSINTSDLTPPQGFKPPDEYGEIEDESHTPPPPTKVIIIDNDHGQTENVTIGSYKYKSKGNLKKHQIQTNENIETQEIDVNNKNYSNLKTSHSNLSHTNINPELGNDIETSEVNKYTIKQ